MPKYEVTYVIQSDAKDILDLQTKPDLATPSPLWVALNQKKEQIQSINVQLIED